MINRLLKLSVSYSSILFGARGVGKSTLLRHQFASDKVFYIDLLDPAEEDRFAREPELLVQLVEGLDPHIEVVIIDEIQKSPRLLDVVHLLLESRQCKKVFVMTGSSARKLKMSGVNLLAGRAFVYHLYPLSFLELGEQFDLNTALQFGLLPKLTEFNNNDDKVRFLQSYALTYLKEEIQAEQLVRKLDPFRKFLEVAAQANSKVINYSNIARDVGVEDKTVKNYFSVLEDTLVGHILEPFQHSFRKRLKMAPKFYFFDVGVVRALARMLFVKPKAGTSYYGELFESFIVTECIKLANYYQLEYKFSYLSTAGGVEVDLVVERPNQPLLMIEIKSHSLVDFASLTALRKISQELGNCEAVCFSNDVHKRTENEVTIYPWQEGVKKFFTQMS